MNSSRRQLLKLLSLGSIAFMARPLWAFNNLTKDNKMNITIRKAEDRGPSDLGWLKSKHTFSFGGYQDFNHMGFETLRVINDDRVVGGAGFGTHPHDNMEIVSYVLDGALEHKDSMGTGSVIRPGDVQRMSAGNGVTHSEYNHSKTDEVHFLQIWFFPDEKNITPSYEQKNFSEADKRGKLKLVLSNDGRDNSVSMKQDVDMYAGLLNGSESFSHEIKEGRKAWVHIARGSVEMNGHKLKDGDGAAVNDNGKLSFAKGNNAEVIIFDMKPIS